MDNPLKWDIFIKVSGQITSNGCGSKARYYYWEFELFFSYYFLLKKINSYVSVQKVVCCSHQSNRLGCVSRTNQIAALGYVSRTNQSVVFVLWFERCSNFNEVMGDSERAVRRMELEWEMLAFLCFKRVFYRALREMRYYWTDKRYQITNSKRVVHAVKMMDSYTREKGVLCTVARSWLLFLHEESERKNFESNIAWLRCWWIAPNILIWAVL